MRKKLIKEKKLAPKIEWLFKRLLLYVLGDGFKKDFIKSKISKKRISMRLS